MNEAIIILLNMRGGCATVGDKIHTLFRVNNRRAQARRVVDRREVEEREMTESRE